MDPKWHIAFCNVTYTEYAGVSFRDYYGSPAVMLEAQLKAREVAESRWGVGRFCHVNVDSPGGLFASYLGMPIKDSSGDEVPYIDTSRPLIEDVAQTETIVLGDPRTSGLMARRYEFWQYYRERGYQVGFGGASGSILTVACEITNGAVLNGVVENPSATHRLLDVIVQAQRAVADFDADLRGVPHHDFGYTGDDYSGLLSPAHYREFAVPCYERLYGAQQRRFMHSELLRAEHLRIAHDELRITDFHGAGCVNLTLAEMHTIMGHDFWTQLTPQEMLELSPAAIADRIAEFAQCGCRYVQLYPGRGTPDANLAAAIEACRKECPGGPHW